MRAIFLVDPFDELLAPRFTGVVRSDALAVSRAVVADKMSFSTSSMFNAGVFCSTGGFSPDGVGSCGGQIGSAFGGGNDNKGAGALAGGKAGMVNADEVVLATRGRCPINCLNRSMAEMSEIFNVWEPFFDDRMGMLETTL